MIVKKALQISIDMTNLEINYEECGRKLIKKNQYLDIFKYMLNVYMEIQ